jgi:hypothetical protein
MRPGASVRVHLDDGVENCWWAQRVVAHTRELRVTRIPAAAQEITAR